MTKGTRTTFRDAAQVPALQRIVQPDFQRGANVPAIQRVPQAPTQGGTSSGSGISTGTSGTGQSNSK